MQKMLPIGRENFKEVIEDNCYYVDKTNIIEEIITNGSKVFLFPRPRRFGKTLTMSMLENYFNIATKKENKNLFKGLKIDKASKNIKQHFGAYPVIKLSLKEVKQDTFEKQYEQMIYILSELYKKHKVVKEILGEKELEIYCSIENLDSEEQFYKNALKQLTKYLERYYSKKVVILIDEYDAPIESGFINGFHDDNVKFLRTLFSGALKTNDSLAFGVLTGILRISQESMLSDLNHFSVYSVLNTKYSEYFGFTHKETEEIFNYYNVELTDDVKNWYDGYRFGENDIYNPWSILKYLDDKELIPHWANTGGLNLLNNLVFNSTYNFKKILKEILEGKSVTGVLDEKVSYKDGLSNDDNMLDFMLFVGYLTYENKRLEDEQMYVDYKCPNIEIKTQIRKLIINWYEKIGTLVFQKNFYKAMFENNIEEMNKELNDIMLNSISYYDTKENFYHGFMLGLFVHLNYEYYINSNKESGLGRYDMTIEDKKGERVYIFEFKIAGEEEELEKYAIEGKNQIDIKNYEQEYIKRGFTKIYKYGVSFNKKSAIIV